ncbi:MAG: dienelactone hydrolase family protein [Rhizobiaceae bacterium]|nr:dienelactone hydrolase family protein [Rhizobiaceae bacterium]
MTITSAASAKDYQIDGVPLPKNVKITASQSADNPHQQWLGTWVGAWGDDLKHILVVRSVSGDGKAQVIYAIGANPAIGIVPDWSKHEAIISKDRLTVSFPGASAAYELMASGTLKAHYARGFIRAVAVMTKAELDTITKPGAKLTWKSGKSEFIETDLVEDGKPVRLEVVIFKPSGPGPFPLAVINHGSTGRGNDAAMFAHTWSNVGLATFLNQRGWLVAFPQRRGRGKSGGLYDEGFSKDRDQGYTCDVEISLAGAERALVDVEAAISILRARPDVAPSSILIGGQSRGGILAVAYAGKHSEQVRGVVNFVGGWMGEICSSAKLINETLFKKGADFNHPSLWLYGKDDPFYSVKHSEGNFEAFSKAGGKGEFNVFDVPGNYGHYVAVYEELWGDLLDEYLRLLKK